MPRACGSKSVSQTNWQITGNASFTLPVSQTYQMKYRGLTLISFSHEISFPTFSFLLPIPMILNTTANTNVAVLKTFHLHTNSPPEKVNCWTSCLVLWPQPGTHRSAWKNDLPVHDNRLFSCFTTIRNHTYALLLLRPSLCSSSLGCTLFSHC